MLLIGVGFLAGAYFSYVDQNTGPEVMASVSDCSGSYGRYSSGVVCQASWVVGGAPPGGPVGSPLRRRGAAERDQTRVTVEGTQRTSLLPVALRPSGVTFSLCG